jgi:hypothetical protein
MNEILFVVEEAEDGSFRANAVGSSIHTEAEDLEQLHQEIRDAVHGFITCARNCWPCEDPP